MESENVEIFLSVFLKMLRQSRHFGGMEDHKVLSWTEEMVQADRFQNENTAGGKLNF